MRGDFWTAQRGNHIFGVIPGNSDATTAADNKQKVIYAQQLSTTES